MSEVISEITISIQQQQDYQFIVTFDKASMPELHTDESAPLGTETGPTPTRMLAAAIGNCLAASMLFASKKAGVATHNIHADVKVQTVRNENRRLRIGKVEVTIDPGFAPEDLEKANKPRALFEDFCTVTQSVRQGFPVEVKVKGIDGD